MYCKPDEIRVLTSLVEDKETFDDDYFIPYIKKAAAMMDSRFSRRYVTPFAEPYPGVVSSICADLAASYILDQHTTERYKDQTTYGEVLYRRAMDTMDRIMAGGELDFVVPLSQGIGAVAYRPAVRSTTHNKRSEIDGVMDKWQTL